MTSFELFAVLEPGDICAFKATWWYHNDLDGDYFRFVKTQNAIFLCKDYCGRYWFYVSQLGVVWTMQGLIHVARDGLICTR